MIVDMPPHPCRIITIADTWYKVELPALLYGKTRDRHHASMTDDHGLLWPACLNQANPVSFFLTENYLLSKKPKKNISISCVHLLITAVYLLL
jgi:hypothetical protein